jgi:hypothetical protein
VKKKERTDINNIIKFEDYEKCWAVSKLQCNFCDKIAIHTYYKDYKFLECSCLFGKITFLLNKIFGNKIITHTEVEYYINEDKND